MMLPLLLTKSQTPNTPLKINLVIWPRPDLQQIRLVLNWEGLDPTLLDPSPPRVGRMTERGDCHLKNE